MILKYPLLAAVVIAAAAGSTFAASGTWSATASTGSWAAAGNWNSSSVAGDTSSGSSGTTTTFNDIATFANSTTKNVTWDAGRTIYGISLITPWGTTN